MNIDDFEAPEYPGNPPDALKLMFERQHQLEQNYAEIERNNGFPKLSVPINLDSQFVQDSIKHSAWCVIEELAEMREAWSEDNVRHAEEEFADALHFMLAIGVKLQRPPIYAGRRTSPVSWVLSFEALATQLGLMCNTLKNKRWKSTHHVTDVGKTYKLYDSAFMWFLEYWDGFLDLGETPLPYRNAAVEHLFNLYFKKSEVNKFRQRSNY